MNNLQTRKQEKLVKYGDIFSVGDHIVACCDSKDAKLVARVIGKCKISAVICDVPYGVLYTEQKAGFSKVKVNKNILNDDIVCESQYTQFTKEWIVPLIPYLNRKNSFYIFNSDKMLFALRDGMEQAGVHFSQLLIWLKNHSVIGRKDYLPMHELIAYGWYGTHAFRKAKDKSLLYCPKPSKSPLHPTQKPVSLLRRLVLNSTAIGDTVIDCFSGSGSLGIACEETKRKSILIELDPEYVQTILNRFEKVFGLKAEKIYEEK